MDQALIKTLRTLGLLGWIYLMSAHLIALVIMAIGAIDLGKLSYCDILTFPIQLMTGTNSDISFFGTMIDSKLMIIPILIFIAGCYFLAKRRNKLILDSLFILIATIMIYYGGFLLDLSTNPTRGYGIFVTFVTFPVTMALAALLILNVRMHSSSPSKTEKYTTMSLVLAALTLLHSCLPTIVGY